MDETTAVLPRGWQGRLVPVCNANTRGATGLCLEVHDLAVSKAVAGPEKDVAFLRALVSHGLARPATLLERLGETVLPADLRDVVASRLRELCPGTPQAP